MLLLGIEYEIIPVFMSERLLKGPAKETKKWLHRKILWNAIIYQNLRAHIPYILGLVYILKPGWKRPFCDYSFSKSAIENLRNFDFKQGLYRIPFWKCATA